MHQTCVHSRAYQSFCMIILCGKILHTYTLKKAFLKYIAVRFYHSLFVFRRRQMPSPPLACLPWTHWDMMTSSNGDIFRVTGHLCGEFTGPPRCIPRTKASDAELWCFFYLRLNKRLSKQSWGWWFETPSYPLWRHRNDRDKMVTISQARVRNDFCSTQNSNSDWNFTEVSFKRHSASNI